MVAVRLDMECESDSSDEPIILKPTARKTFLKSVLFERDILSETRILNNAVNNNIGANRNQTCAAEFQDILNQHQQQSHFTRLAQMTARSESGHDEVELSSNMLLKIQPVNVNVVVTGQQSTATTFPPPPPVFPISSVMLDNTYEENVNTRPDTMKTTVLPWLQSKPLPTRTSNKSKTVSNQIDCIAHKLTEQVKCMVMGMLTDMSADGCTEATVKLLQLNIEQIQRKHQQEVTKLKHCTTNLRDKLTRLSTEKHRAILEIKKKFKVEMEAAIVKTKNKQWCSLCKKEALFYCCWNTAYCNYSCQQAHWPHHMLTCAQTPTQTKTVAQ